MSGPTAPALTEGDVLRLIASRVEAMQNAGFSFSPDHGASDRHRNIDCVAGWLEVLRHMVDTRPLTRITYHHYPSPTKSEED